MSRIIRSLTLVLTLAAPAVAQEPPDVNRLQDLRLQRMEEALSLSEEQAAALRSAMQELRDQTHALRETERETMEQLGQALRREPADTAAVARALEAVEERRAQAERLRTEHRQRLAEVLGPEQRARFLLFNHQFDSRLRELVDRRRGAAPGPGRPGVPAPPSRRDDRGRGEGGQWLELRLQGLPPAERRQAIERLRRALDRLERDLEAED